MFRPGAYVMERACTDAVIWQRRMKRPIQVAVNVSSVQFARDSFIEEVEDILRRTGLKPSLLQIELTESATLTGVERTAEMMRRLKSKGISVAMDDFGTGYSCLSYLPKLCFDALKLDRSFVNELVVHPETRGVRPINPADGAQPPHEGNRRGDRDQGTAGSDQGAGHERGAGIPAGPAVAESAGTAQLERGYCARDREPGGGFVRAEVPSPRVLTSAKCHGRQWRLDKPNKIRTDGLRACCTARKGGGSGHSCTGIEADGFRRRFPA